MKNGKCEKGFPKAFQDITEEDDRGFPLYRRRRAAPGANVVTKMVNGVAVEIDNRWVVPYNPNLLLYHNKTASHAFNSPTLYMQLIPQFFPTKRQVVFKQLSP